MKALTLRTAKTLPAAYAKGDFFVRIGGEITRCATLAEAQRATAYVAQDRTVTLMTPAAHAAYIAKRGNHR